MTDHPAITARDYAWEGCTNTRDLGGLPTRDGAVTRHGALIRSDMLYRLTPLGRQQMLADGVHTIVDLRTPGELDLRPSPFDGSDPTGPRYLHLSLESDDPGVRAMMVAAPGRAEVYRVQVDNYPANIAAVMRAIAAYADGALVYHCFAGKDRTGIISALLLDLADVPDEIITADYALTEARGWEAYAQIVAENGGTEISAEDMAAPPAAMQAVLDHVRSRYGSTHRYLAWAGLTQLEIARLRGRLRDD